MIFLIVFIIGFDLFFLLATSGTESNCVSSLTKDANSDVKNAQETCKFLQNIKSSRSSILGISLVLIVVCGLVFYFKRD